MYLDDETAGATMFFLSQGIRKEHLIPVNSCERACENIFSVSGVRPICGNIDARVVCESHRTFCFVWLDYIQARLDADVMASVVQKAFHVAVTLVRTRKTDVVKTATQLLTKTPEADLVQTTWYRGKPSKMFPDGRFVMAYFLIKSTKFQRMGDDAPTTVIARRTRVRACGV